MKSIETRFNEALAELKEKASAKKYTKVWEKTKTFPTIEAQLNCVEEALAKVLKEADPLGIGNPEDWKRDVAILFGVEPWPTNQPTHEAAPVVKKHNGAAENFSESNPLQRAEGRSAPITETSNKR